MAANNFPSQVVLYVHGNHEAYGMNLEGDQRNLESEAARFHNVHFLNCGEHTFENVRFLGVTLWTDFKLYGEDSRQASMLAAASVMLDYKRIRIAARCYGKLRPSDTTHFHVAQKVWLRQKIAEPFSEKTVVITRMAPSFKYVAERCATDPVSAAYASHLDDLTEHVDLWVHGYTHDSFDYRIGECRVVCNPCGYMMRSGGTENPNFDPNFIVEV